MGPVACDSGAGLKETITPRNEVVCLSPFFVCMRVCVYVKRFSLKVITIPDRRT